MEITQNPTISFLPQVGGAPGIYYIADGSAIFGCVGNPENVIAANVRSLAIDEAGNVYVKASGSGASGWQAIGGGGGGTTINPTNEFVPYRLNATTFADSPIRRTGAQTIFITDGVTNFVSLGTGGIQVYQDGSSTFPVVNLNSSGGLYVTSSNPVMARGGSAHTVFASGQLLSVSDGTVSLPAYSFNSDNDSGIYRQGTNSVSVAGAGVEVLRVVGGAGHGTALQVSSAAAGSGVTLTALSGGTDENLNLSTKGNGVIVLTSGAVGSARILLRAVDDSANGLTYGTNGSGLKQWGFILNNVQRYSFQEGFATISVSYQWGWSSGNSTAFNPDTGLARAAAGVVRITNGSVGAGGLLLAPSTVTADGQLHVQSASASRQAIRAEGTGSPSANIIEARLTNAASVFAAFSPRESLFLAPLATIPSPSNGDVWIDSSRNALAARISGQNLFHSSAIFRSQADKLVDNSTTETTLLSSSFVGTATIAANLLQPGKVIRLKAKGYWNTDAGNSSFNIRFKVGGVTVATGAINATASMTALPWDCEIEATLRSAGVTGTIMIAGSFNNIQDGTTRAAYKWDLNAGAAGTVDTTGALTVDLTAQLGTATVDNYINCTSLIIEILG